MRIKASISFFFLFLLSLSATYGQDSNTVYYSLFLEKSVAFGTIDTKVDEGEFKEGNSFIIPEAELPNSPVDFSLYQDLYNALVGGRFGIDYGALNNDIIMKIFIRNLDPAVGKYLSLGREDDTLFSYFEIRIWELPDSNYFPEDSSYYFNEGYFATFSLPKSTALLNFFNTVGINPQDSLAFAFMENLSDGKEGWNGFGIDSEDTPDSITFKSIHLSRIGGGRKTIADEKYNPTAVNSIRINQLNGVPDNFKLDQNYPNPFNPSTKISYSISESGDIQLDIYNILGSHVINLVNSYQAIGNYQVEFTAENSAELTSGIYIYTLKTRNKSVSKKMILMK